MFQLPGQQQYQQYGAPTGQSPLYQYMCSTIDNYINGLVRDQQLNPYQGSQIVTSLKQNADRMIARITSDPRYSREVPPEVVGQIIASATRDILISIQQQNQQQPIQQHVAPIQFGGGGGTISMDNRPAQSFQAQLQQQPEPVAKPTGKMTLKRSISAQHSYTSINEDTSGLSTECKTGQIISVITKQVISDEHSNKYNYCKATAHIPEPSLKNVINNFVKTNPSLCAGRFIVDLNFSRFIIREEKKSSCETIDISPLTDPNWRNYSISSSIRQVIKSITARNFGIVGCLEEIIVKEMNDQLMKRVRLSENIWSIPQIEDLNDIIALPDLNSKSFGNICFHPKYQETIFKCFYNAIVCTITDLTRNGFYDNKTISPHLLTCPNFVIRDNGLCERELDDVDEAFVNAVDVRFTTFADNGNVVVANFIPEDLDQDLPGNAILLENTTNPFDYLFSSIWKYEPKTIYMNENGRELVMSCCLTMDEKPFVQIGTIDLEYGLSTCIQTQFIK